MKTRSSMARGVWGQGRMGTGALAVLFLLATGFTLNAASTQSIRLKKETITTASQSKQIQPQAVEPPVSGLYLVQFDGPIQPAWTRDLREMNVDLLRYTPENAFVARLTEVRLNRLRALPFVYWVGEYRPFYKLHGALDEAEGRPADERIAVRALLTSDADPREIKRMMARFPQLKPWSHTAFGVIFGGSLTRGQTKELCELSCVLWVEPDRKPQLFDEEAVKIIAGDDDQRGTEAVIHQLGYDGSGTTVAVADSGLDGGTVDSLHPDLRGRAVEFFHYGPVSSAADGHGHGTHVTGIIAGDASTGQTDDNGALYGLGVAPGTEIVVQRIFDDEGTFTLEENDFRTLSRDAVTAGAEIGSNSWGEDTQGEYDMSAAEYDALVRDADDQTPGDQPYILEFSAGNSGPGRGTIGSPAVAKNVIASGASQNNRFDLYPFFPIYNNGQEAMADFSSRGPAADGRFKPDVVAPGTWIASAQSTAASAENAWLPISNLYMYQGGTSQSGPHVSGAAAVWVQYYRENFTNTTPSPALVKAALINSAVDMDDASGTGPIPNHAEGWGRIDMTRLITTNRALELVDQTELLTTDETFEQSIFVGNRGEPLKITLAYTDVPGFPAAIPALVNDLNLEVIGPNGAVYLGNQFEEGESVSDAGNPDQINNVEAVYLNQPLAGEYTVRVHGANVPQDARSDTAEADQDFALVISGDLPLPGTGIVSLDRAAYTAPAEMRIQLIDFDLTGEPEVAVEVRSDSLPEGKTVMLQPTERPGVYAAVLTTITGGDPAPDELPIAHGDRIEVVYQDASPQAERTAEAIADLLPPQISQVEATSRFGNVEITWTTDEPATSTVEYGVDTLDLTESSSILTTSHSITLTDLAEETTYQFVLSSTDAAGNTAVVDDNGVPFEFDSGAAATVLLVDAFFNDFLFGQAPPLSNYTNPLEAIGVSYEVWDVQSMGSPTLAELQSFRLVIWRLPELSVERPTFTAEEQQRIRDYLDGGGSLFVASMEVLTRLEEEGSDFAENVLQVRSFEVDVGAGAVTGIPNDPISDQMEMELNYTDYGDFDISDIFTPTTNAVPVLRETVGGNPVGLRSPRVGQEQPGRVVFLSFPFDALPAGGADPNNRTAFMKKAVQFLVPGIGGLGTIALDQPVYTIPSLVTVEVADIDLTGEGPITVEFFSDSSPEGTTVELQETLQKGLFRGFATLTAQVTADSPEFPQIEVTASDEIWAEYVDTSAETTIQARAGLDVQKPEIGDIEVEPDFEVATVRWTTSEPGDSLVQFGESRFLGRTAFQGDLKTEHELVLTGLLPDRQYFFQVVSRDEAGNTRTENQNGDLFTFRTLKPIVPPWTDDLESGVDQWRVVENALIPASVYTLAFGPVEWQDGTPANGRESSAVSPQNAWGSNLDGRISDGADSLLLSPAIQLTGGNRATLHFQQSYDFTRSLEGEIIPETAEIYVARNNGQDLTMVQAFTGITDGWEPAEVDLTPYLGQTIQLGFYYGFISFNDNLVPGWLLDDISVTVAHVEQGTIEIRSNLTQAEFDLTGPAVRQDGGQLNRYETLPAGEYTLRWNELPYYQTPPEQTQTLEADQELVFEGDYTFEDTNGNGMADAWEESFFGEISEDRNAQTDTDGDHFTDLAEFKAGTDPNDPDSYLHLDAPSIGTNGDLTLQWPSESGHGYQLSQSSNLVDWTPASDWLRADGSNTTHSAEIPQNGAPTFFRIETRP